MRYHLTPVIKKTSDKCWSGYGKKGTLVCYWRHQKLMQPQWKIVWRWLKKFKTEVPYDLAILLLGWYTKKMRTGSQRDIYTSIAITGLFTIANIWKEFVSNRWMDRDVIRRENGILFSHKKDKNSAICNSMDGPWGHYTKRNKSERKRQILHGITHVESKKKS